MDIDTLIQRNFISKLKLNTKYYDNITAYSVTSEFRRQRGEIPSKQRADIDQLMQCPRCGTLIKVLIENRKALIICPECNHSRVSGFFDIENIPYHSVAYFSGGGR